MKEIWKVVPGFPDYSVSNHGRVKSFKWNKERIMKPLTYEVKNRNGYIRSLIQTRENGVTKTWAISKLVAICFLNHVPNGYNIVVDHIDFNPENNRVDNLQLISNAENVKRGIVPKGYYFEKESGKFKVQFSINGRMRTFGRFKIESDAISKASEIKNSEIYTKQWSHLR